MEKGRANNTAKESGIALVTALVITVVVLMLISSLTYLFTKGFQTNVLNRKFSSVYEAANGGVEYAAGIVNVYLGGATPTNMGWTTVTGGKTFTDIAKCSTTTDSATVVARTADGEYIIAATIQCLGMTDIPGYGGMKRFPPPPAMTGGGTGNTPTGYFFYSLTADATESNSPSNIGRTQAVYRVVQ